MIFPPGRARLETSPVPTGSLKAANTMGIVALAFLAAKIVGPAGDDDVNFETNQFGCKVRQPFEFPFCISVLNDNVFPFDIAKLAQPLAKCFDPGRLEGRGAPAQDSYPGYSRRLLRLGHRPAYRECEREGDKPSLFAIFDFGLRFRSKIQLALESSYHVLSPNPKS